MNPMKRISDPKDAMLTRISACIGTELAAVDRQFDLELASDFKSVSNLVKHVARFRGKMLRPMLVLLAGRACGQVGADHIVIATVVEMVHMATLVHDDVLDEAELRRKGATINHLRGNEAAVMLGDYLISHSYHLCSSLDSQLASRTIAAATNRVCEGELMQIDNRNNIDLDEPTYLRIISLKTAALCATCCRLGALLAGADDARAAKLERYGLNLGIAFQIQDDILDLVGDAATVGKTLGIDVEKGKMTLPLIHFLRTAPAEHRSLLRALLAGHEPDQAEKIRNLILPGDAISYARATARKLVESARESLADLPQSAAKALLTDIADYVVTRQL